MSKTTTQHLHHAFLYISLPSLHNYDDLKWPNFLADLRTGNASPDKLLSLSDLERSPLSSVPTIK